MLQLNKSQAGIVVVGSFRGILVNNVELKAAKGESR